MVSRQQEEIGRNLAETLGSKFTTHTDLAPIDVDTNGILVKKTSLKLLCPLVCIVELPLRTRGQVERTALYLDTLGWTE